jgi:hypothetical protein
MIGRHFTAAMDLVPVVEGLIALRDLNGEPDFEVVGLEGSESRIGSVGRCDGSVTVTLGPS